jgi:hypothetical protein
LQIEIRPVQAPGIELSRLLLYCQLFDLRQELFPQVILLTPEQIQALRSLGPQFFYKRRIIQFLFFGQGPLSLSI